MRLSAILLLALLLLAACTPGMGETRTAPGGGVSEAEMEPLVDLADLLVDTQSRPPTATSPVPAAPSHTASSQPTSIPTPASEEPPQGKEPLRDEKLILVRIYEQRVYAFQGGALVFDFPISTGRNQNTLSGHFQVLDKLPNSVNVRWGYSMPHWMGVYWVNRELENGFHALPVLPDGSRLWADEIGSPASDGCIVLQPEDMRQLYEWAEVGTRVIIED